MDETFENVKQDPSRFYSTPADLLKSDRYSKAEKEEILQAWRYDAIEMQVAASENMAGGERDLLDQIHKALSELESE